MSPGFSRSSARLTNRNRPSEPDRFRASILVVEKSEIIHRLEQDAISIHLRADPSLQAFHIHNSAIGRLVVVHCQQDLCPTRKPLFVFLCTYGEVAMAASG